MKYRAYGVALSSALDLPELERADDLAPVALTVTVDARPIPDEGWQWLQPRLPDEAGPWVAIAKRSGEHRILFDTGVDFVAAVNARSIVVHPGASPVDAVRHRLIDQVLPLVLAHLGRFVLHASAVAVPPAGAAVAFIGASGAGKSTLAAAFGRAGASVLSDDALVVEAMGGVLHGVPAYAGVRVRPDMLPVVGDAPLDDSEGKRRVGAKDGVRFADRPAPLRRIYVLRAEAGAPVAIQPLPPRETIMALVAHAFVLDVADRRRIADQFARVAAASADADVRTLTYPHCLSALTEVCDAVRADLERR